MATNFTKFKAGLNVQPVAGSTVTVEGDTAYNATNHQLEVFGAAAAEPIATSSNTVTFSNKSISADSNTLTNIANAAIKAAAAIAVNKLAALATSVAVATDGSGFLTTVATTATELGYVSGVTSALQTQLNNKQATGNYITALTGNVTASGPGSVAATIAASAVVDSMISASAAITRSKTASGTNYRILANNSSGVMAENAALTASANILSDANGQLVAGTPSIAQGGTGQTSKAAAFDALSPMTTLGDIVYGGTSGTGTRLAVGTENQVVKIVNGIPAWAAAPSGGVNYVAANPDAEVGTTGWITYADAAGTTPVDATGGSPTTTFTRSTSSPLRGTGSFLVTKDAANRQGEGASFAFTIDAADQGKVLTATFDYTVGSGTYATGDLTVYIYDVTNAVVIQPAGYQIQSVVAGTNVRQITTFQTASNSTSYRLALHVATTSASAYTIKLDNVFVGPQTVQYGAPVTDWTPYTVAITASSGGAVKGTTSADQGYWRRVGDALEVRYDYIQTGAGTAGTGSYLFSLPTGLTVDTTKLPNLGLTGIPMLGTGFIRSNTSEWDATVYFYDTTHLAMEFQSAVGTARVVGSGDAPLSTAVTRYSFVTGPIPVSGWSASVQMSSDSETRVVVARATGTDNATYSSGVAKIVNYNTIVNDTHGAITTGSSWKFTAPVAGYYEVEAAAEITSTGNGSGDQYALDLYKNTALFSRLDNFIWSGAPTCVTQINGKDTLLLSAGDTLDVRINEGAGTRTTTTSTTNNHIVIKRVSGPSAIAASNVVAAKYFASAGTTSTTSTPVEFATKVFDTHGAVSAAPFKFTAPMAGFYQYKLFCNTSSGTNATYLSVYKNGTLYENAFYSSNVTLTFNGTGMIQLLAGDYIDFRCATSTAVSGNASQTNGSASIVEIWRLGGTG